jgi:uncharacterized protein
MTHDRPGQPPDVTRPVTALWRRVDIQGLEYCSLHDSGRPSMAGTVIVVPDDGPVRVEYAIECTAAWETAQVRIDATTPEGRVRFELARDDALRWTRDGVHVPTLDGCEDVDLSVTPSTNTLPIRRLALGVGESRDVTAAWIRFPSCAIEPLPQRYTRVADRRYRYESRGGAFTAELEVDAKGMVLDYPPVWERVRR